MIPVVVVAFPAMTYKVAVVLTLCCLASAYGQSAPPMPTEFEIGRRTFFDFGPPFDFYELFLVRPTANGAAVERITLTPAADACTQPAKVEVASGTIRESVSELFGKTNPCAISEKDLRRELKRCKKCLVFSGANVTMQVQCGGQPRIIRADVFDRDMFDPSSNTPHHTSWTMQLLGRIDHAVGPGVMDRPAFSVSEERGPQPQDSEALREISSGKYDLLFKSAPDRPSDLYHAAQIAPPVPTIRLVSSTPIQPEVFIQPAYPPIAKLARIDGTVNFTLDVSADGTATNFTVQSGHPMLRGATEKAVGGWKFPKDAAGQTVHLAVEFATNCPAKKQ